ncbi:transcription-repair coupling factor [Acidobacteriota bacterium]
MQGNLSRQINRIINIEVFSQALAALRDGRPCVLSGLADGLKPLSAFLLARDSEGPVCLLVPDAGTAEAILGALNVYASHSLSRDALAGFNIAIMPGYGTSPYLGASPHLAIMRDRLRSLDALVNNRLKLLILPVEAAAFKLPSPGIIRKITQIIKKGEDKEREDLVAFLEKAGYRRQSMVGSRGDYAVRGGIVDFFSPQAEQPCRIEFYGDTVDSIRTFELDSQRSRNELDAIHLLPIREFPLPAEASKVFEAKAQKRWADSRTRSDLEAKQRDLATRGSFAGLEFFLPLFCTEIASIFDYLEGWSILAIEQSKIQERIDRLYEALEEEYEGASAGGMAVLEPQEICLQKNTLKRQARQVALELCGIPVSGTSALEVLKMRSQPQRSLSGSINEVIKELNSDTSQKRDAVVFLQSAGEAERFSNLLSEYGLPFMRVDTYDGHFDAPAGVVYVARGEIAEGFRCADAGLMVYSEQELFGEVRRRERKRKDKAAAFASDFRDLKAGDYVVHVDHGIGKFIGLEGIRANGSTSECMVIEYKNLDKLYVPLERLDLVHKYSGAEGAVPRIDVLGGKTWAKQKQRIKRSMRNMTQELLNLYATRSVLKGNAFPSDDHFQREFEDAFAFEETADQDEAIKDIKKDLESDRITDRLLCGDVGYGKTEVAMRAAFKCVLGGKQVAALVPTTVLAFQHYNTFRERFKMFPVNIEMISRFRSRQEQKKIIQDLKEGKVDILIGTHRLLSKDVEFNNLGLLVVDEEQRFGVTHKEKIKKFRKGVEVLAMSATPIPRTLHMSMTGIRDISLINTPPQNRIAIETRVLPFSAKVIREGIEHELARGGQVYFVHNRVESIYTITGLLRRLCPNARYGIGHGQMVEKELESVMIRFLSREFDVLVATTIIENGLDIPNVNTIFMNRAHMFGLSQLYQLRGRVGRSDRPAYAYLLVPRSKRLTPEARKRLFAIQEFSDLGSGFRIAAMDLEIRGAGNVLGREQHGQMMAVGFDMYMKLLEQTVREIKGEEGEIEEPATISLTVGASVPIEFIEDVNLRIMVYKKISSARTETEVTEISAEIQDRFGSPLPEPLKKLLALQRLKLMASEMKVGHIDREGVTIRMKLTKKSRINPDRLIEFINKAPEQRRFNPSGLLIFRVPEGGNIIESTRDALIELA